MVDFGYDISDHCKVDPVMGTMADFDALVEAAHARGARPSPTDSASPRGGHHPPGWIGAAVGPSRAGCDSRRVPADETDQILERFVAEIRPVVPLVALWAHGSLAAGDYQPGRSDLDLIAVVDAEVTKPQTQQLERVHQRLGEEHRLAAKLHCTYVAVLTLPGASREHLTWAHQELMHRTITPVSRRELLEGGAALFGPPPTDVLPPVTDEELRGFIRTDLAEFWLPATRRRVRWLKDVWVDLGLLTPARAAVTLQDGRLITKREALDVLVGLDAPARVIDDIRERRYSDRPGRTSWAWRLERAELTRTFAQAAIDRILAG
jgi:hypothetical protein